MDAKRAPSTVCGCNASVSRSKEHLVSRTSKVLADRNQAVVPVGAWVEGGQHFPEHPSALAVFTEELQAELRRENEESLRRFQHQVRHRVAQVSKKKLQKRDPAVKPDRRIPPPQQRRVRPQHVSAGETLTSPQKERPMNEYSEGLKQVRLRLAACQMIPRGEMTSDLPKWSSSLSRHKSEAHVLKMQKKAEEEAAAADSQGGGKEEAEDSLCTSQQECPLVQDDVTERPDGSNGLLHDVVDGSELDIDTSKPGADAQSKARLPWVPWTLTDKEEQKKQRQSHFLTHRRLVMNIEREQVKKNRQQRKHLKRTARIKAEKEQIRQEEERKFERVRQLTEARRKVEERELLILEQLRLEEEERTVHAEQAKREEQTREAARYIEALKAQLRERISQRNLDPPPLCCCASSFWDSHPDTCANNCVFHNNPKVYAQALQSAMLSLDLQ